MHVFLLSFTLAFARGQDVALIAEKEAAVAEATGMDVSVLKEAMRLAQHGDTEASLVM